MTEPMHSAWAPARTGRVYVPQQAALQYGRPTRTHDSESVAALPAPRRDMRLDPAVNRGSAIGAAQCQILPTMEYTHSH